MAEEPIGSFRTPNGDTVALKVGTKSVAGSALAVIAVLLIGTAALGGGIIAKILFLGQASGQAALVDLRTTLTEQRAATQAIITQTQEVRGELQEHMRDTRTDIQNVLQRLEVLSHTLGAPPPPPGGQR